MLKFILAVAVVVASLSANAQISGDLDHADYNQGGYNQGGYDQNNGYDNGGYDNGDYGRRRDRTNWVFQQVDNSGCKRCQVRADQWQTKGCRDFRAYERICNRNNIGIRLACRQPGTKNNDIVYICQYTGR